MQKLNKTEKLSFANLLLALENISEMKAEDQIEFIEVLKKYLIQQEAKIDELEKDLNSSKHDISILKNFNGVQ